jgi:hypothetical protein
LGILEFCLDLVALVGSVQDLSILDGPRTVLVVRLITLVDKTVFVGGGVGRLAVDQRLVVFAALEPDVLQVWSLICLHFRF